MFFEQLISFLSSFGYTGGFLIAIAGCCIPMASPFSNSALFLLGSQVNPWFLGIIAAAGGTIGECIGYFIGSGSRHIGFIEKHFGKNIEKFSKEIDKRFGLNFAIFLFAATPLPDDFVNIPAGLMRLKLQRFLLMVFLGKTVFYTVLGLSGSYGWQWLGTMLS